MSNVHISLVMIVKNEEKRLKNTLLSVLGYVDSFIIFDTGSTDNTINILKDFSKENNIPLYLLEGTFIDFSTSRNICLDFADTIVSNDFLLLLDSNDELRGAEFLRKFCQENKDKPNTGYYVLQEWWNGFRHEKYYNLKMVKSRKGWRYRGRVHEYLYDTGVKNNRNIEISTIRIPDRLSIYQDRTQDDDKSKKRYETDKVILLEELKDNPTDSRSIFYLARTYMCLGNIKESFNYFKIRTNLEGFSEELFESFLKCGELSQKLKHDWYESFNWYIKAFEIIERVEPLLHISSYYMHKNWFLSYTFASLACKLSYPHRCRLFVDKHAYDYVRWHFLSVSGWYAGFFKEGRIACVKAISSGFNIIDDNIILKYYDDRDKLKG